MSRHVVSMSGGKDSTALAVHLLGKKSLVPHLEFIFADTGKELPETYEYLDTIEQRLDITITRLGADKGFDWHLAQMNGYLPSARARWCTRVLKIQPITEYIGDDPTIMYIGLRADEDRRGHIAKRPNIIPAYPFIDDGLGIAEVKGLLEESGVGFPSYYRWRTRSGCFFCFFQRLYEWVGLLHNHPDLFEEAASYEKEGFTWISYKNESLRDLAQPERVADITRKHERKLELARERNAAAGLGDVLDGEMVGDACIVCSV